MFSGCAAKMETARMPNEALATMSFEQLEAELRRGEAEMRAAGVPVATVAMAAPGGGMTNAPGGDAAVGESESYDDADGDVADTTTSTATPTQQPAPPPADAPAAPAEPMMEPESADEEVSAGVAAKSRDRRSERKQRRAQCTNICDLANTMCGLETRICDLAAQHPDQPRYANVCIQAQSDCTRAREACHAC